MRDDAGYVGEQVFMIGLDARLGREPLQQPRRQVRGSVGVQKREGAATSIVEMVHIGDQSRVDER